MIASKSEIEKFAAMKLDEARKASGEIPFHLVENYAADEHYQRGQIKAANPTKFSIVDNPRYGTLKHGAGQLAWAIVLAVDLRNSSQRAERYGAETTFITMHTYLPTMAFLVGKIGGQVIGLRGDGLFAGFQIIECAGESRVFTEAMAKEGARQSIECGKAMLDTVSKILNPLLRRENLPDGLNIGIGIDFGSVVITRIGIDSANEITAYGKAVNQACNNAVGQNQIWISKVVKDFFPTGKGGLVKFAYVNNQTFRLDEYPYEIISNY